MPRVRGAERSDGGPGADYPRLSGYPSPAFPPALSGSLRPSRRASRVLPLAATGGGVRSLPGEASRLLAESGAPD